MKTRNIHSSILTLILFHFLAVSARAFDCGFQPDVTLGLLTLGEEVHQAIVRDGLSRVKGYHVNWNIVVGDYLKFFDLDQQNERVDDSIGQHMEKYHFDDEKLMQSSRLLAENKETIIQAALAGQGWNARKPLGESFHTLADFYSHGNWVELGHKNGEVYPLLGRELITDPATGWANCNVTCASKYHKICLWCWRKNCKCKWFIEWWGYDNNHLGNAGLTTLTTGYSWRLHPFGRKVIHGLNKLGIDGLNKDEARRPGYSEAYHCAVNAISNYVAQILDDVRIKGASDEAIISALRTLGFEYGTQVHPVGFVVDNSADMPDSVFAEIKQQVHDLVAAHRGRADEPPFYVLQWFDFNPSIPEPCVTPSATAFLNKLDTLARNTTSGPCLKAFIPAMFSAVDRCDAYATVWGFCGDNVEGCFDVNGQSGCYVSLGTIESIALYRHTRINVAIRYNCPSKKSQAIFDIANATGGNVFVIGPNATTNLTGLMDSDISGNVVPLLSVSGTLATNTVKEYTVPIDSTVTNVTFVVSVETNTAISFVTPSGADLTNAPCCPIWELMDGRVATVAQPELGNWHIQVEGSGHFSVNVNAMTPIALSRFAFLEDKSNTGAGVYMPIPGQPTEVTNAAKAFLSGIYSNANFSLVTPAGDLVQSFAMAPYTVTNLPTNGMDGVVYTGTVALASPPFKVMATGSDINGYPFQRVFPQVFQLQSVEVRSLKTNLNPITPGVPSHVRYLVSNRGSNGVFAVGMAASHAIVTNLEPTTLSLANGETNVVEADIILSAGTNNPTREYITVAVVCTNAPAIRNGTVDEFDVGPAYVGDTTIACSSNSPVTLSLSQPEQITSGPAGGDLVLIGGASTATLDLNGHFQTINGLRSQGVEANTRVTSDRRATLIVGEQDANASFGGKIVNAVELVKIGGGAQTLTGINTYTNTTSLVSGVLALEDSGSISNTSLILIAAGATFDVSKTSGGWTLNAGQTLAGGGVVTGSVTAASASWIEAGNGGSTLTVGYNGGTPTFANDLTLSGDVTNVFVLNPPPTNALITVAGNLTLNGVNPVLIGFETLPAGRYRLMTYGGSLTGNAAANLELFCFADDVPENARQSAVLDDSIPGEIDLVVMGSLGNLTWVGDGVLNNWDEATTNWFNGASPDRFFTGDAVTFDASGSRTPAANLVSNLVPSSILVNAAGDYTFAGSGSLTTTTLVKTNSGTLVIANSGTNAILQLQLDCGTVQVGDGGTNGSLGSVTVYNNASLVFNRSDTMVWDKPIVGTGSVVQAGSGTLLLSATNTYSGPTTVSNGVLAVYGDLLGGGTVTIQDGATLIVGNLGSDGLDGVISGPVTVQAGGTLGGNGTILGPVTVQPAGEFVVIDPDTTVDETGSEYTVRNRLSLEGAVLLRINRTNTQNSDRVIGITTLTYGGTLAVTNKGPALQAGDSFKLFDAANYTNFFSAISPTTPGIGIGWDLQRLVVDGTLRVEATTMSYTNTIPAGLSLLANQLNAPGGNAVDHVFPNPIDGCMIWKWDCATQDWLVAAQYDSGSGGWVDEYYNPLDPATVTLSPGEAFRFFNPDIATPVIFSGTIPTPVLPLPLPCGRGKFSAVACQTPATATWGTIIGIEPEEGDILERFHVPSQTYLTNLFTGGQWVPTNPVVNVGEGVLVRLPSIPAGDKYKANNALTLNQAGSWTNNAVPGPGDVAIWSSIVAAPNTTNDLGADMTWGGIKILDPGGPIWLTGSNTLTLAPVENLGTNGLDGITLSSATQDLTVNCPVRVGASQAWNVGSGRLLTVDSVLVDAPIQFGGLGGLQINSMHGEGVYPADFVGSSYTSVGPISGDLTVNVSGTGTVVLDGTNTYTGPTTVSNGVLVVNGWLAGRGPVTVVHGTLAGTGVIEGPVSCSGTNTTVTVIIDPDGTVDDTGTCIVRNNLSLDGTVRLRLDRTNLLKSDCFAGMSTVSYGGTLAVTNKGPALQAGDSFKLFDATNYTGSFAAISPATPGIGIVWDLSYLPVDGTLRIKASVATNPINLTASVIGGSTLQLAWPADHIGWTLESQTNSVSVGLGTNWLPVLGSTLTNQMTMPITPANGSVFYRLKYAP